MDVTKILEKDHRQVEQLFDKIEKADGKARQPFIDELATSLRGHMELEEQVVYPAMEPVTGHEPSWKPTPNTTLLAQGSTTCCSWLLTNPVSALPSTRSRQASATTSTRRRTMYSRSSTKKGSSVLEEMATPFMKKRAELGLPMETDALAAASTKDRLVQEAKRAGVDGAASMTKDELADALAKAMT